MIASNPPQHLRSLASEALSGLKHITKRSHAGTQAFTRATPLKQNLASLRVSSKVLVRTHEKVSRLRRLAKNGVACHGSLSADETTDKRRCRHRAKTDWPHHRSSVCPQNSLSRYSNMHLNTTTTTLRHPRNAAPRCWSSLRSVKNSETLE